MRRLHSGVVLAIPVVLLLLVVGFGPSNLSSTRPTHPSPAVSAPSDYPAGRWGAAVAYDPAGPYVVLFAGSDGKSDTWTFSNGTWTEPYEYAPPSPRTGACMVWDARDNYVLLFGGFPGGSTTTYLNDTWEFAHGTWTELFPPTSPPGRDYAACAYDAADGYVVLFGGTTATQSFTNETWAYAAGQWTRLRPAQSPAPRLGASMLYDAADGYVVMYGGRWNNSAASQGLCLPAFCPYLDDTWKFVGGNWTLLSPSLYPPGRLFASAIYDSGNGEGLLFGGQANSYKSYNSSQDATWTFHQGEWSNVTPSLSPPSRFSAALADDLADGYVVLFGGLSATVSRAPVLDDTWTYANGSWTEISPHVNQNKGGARGSFPILPIVLGGTGFGLIVAILTAVRLRRRPRREAGSDGGSEPSPPSGSPPESDATK